MKKKKTNRIRVFYYSHPYLVIFNILIVYNIAVILLFSLLLAYLNDGTINSKNYLEAIQYCAIYTMNSGDIWSDAPTSVIILKIVINTVQMITFSGALIGLATSMLQNLFNSRVHNLGKLKLKNHYVILNWSSIGANLIKELYYMEGRKTIVVLSSKNRDEISDEIDNLFLESGLDKKNIRIFVKYGNPTSRKALKEVSIERCSAIALLSKTSWGITNDLNDADSFKILMAILSLKKDANIIVEANDNTISKQIDALTKATNDLNRSNISLFSRNSIVGHALGRAAINTAFADLYNYLLSFEGGTFYSINKEYDVKEALSYYNNAIPISRYNENDGDKLYLYSHKMNFYKSLTKKEAIKEINFSKNLVRNSFTLFVIGNNEKAHSILDVCNSHNNLNDGKITCNIYPLDVDIDKFVDDVNKTLGKKKILIFSDENVGQEELDNNVILTLIKLRTNPNFNKKIEIFAEIFDPQSRFSLNSLNVSSMIISNEMVALYVAQLLTHPESHHFYEDLLIKNFESNDIKIDFDLRRASELIKMEDELTFNSKLEFIDSLYKASNYEYLPIGFVGVEARISILDAATKVVDISKQAADKLINSVANALTLNETSFDTTIDKSNIMIFDSKLRRQEKIVIKKDTVIILVHYHK